MRVSANKLAQNILFAICFSLFLYFGAQSIDLPNYQIAYEKNWYQFEPLFNAAMKLSQSLSLSFHIFWMLLGLAISFFFSRIYIDYRVIFLAMPNIIYLMLNSFSTQLRFALACLLFCYLVQRRHIIFTAVVPSVHVLSFVPLAIYFSSISKKTTLRGSTKFNSILKFSAIFIGIFVAKIVILRLVELLGYQHYLNSKYFSQKSLVSTIYIVVSFILVGFLFTRSVKQSVMPHWHVLAMYTLFTCVVFIDFAIISGRLLNFYFLLEIFVFVEFFKILKKNLATYIFLIVYYMFTCSKLLSVTF